VKAYKNKLDFEISGLKMAKSRKK